MERNVLENAGTIEVADLEHHVPDRARLRHGLAHLASDHHADDLVVVEFGCGTAPDEASVPQHGDAIGDPEDFIEPMRHEYDAEPLGLQIVHDLEQAIDLGARQGRRRLVHDEDAGILGDGPRDLDELAVGRRQAAGQVSRREVRRYARQSFSRPRTLLLNRNQPVPARPAAQHDVLGHRHAGNEVGVLVNGRYAGPMGRGRVGRQKVAANPDLAAIG